jgi:hydroxymethylbilane synthase
MKSDRELLPEVLLNDAGEIGIFTTRIQDALLRAEIDIAVHSLKDLPVQEPEGLVIAAIPTREDPSDALVSRSGLGLANLPASSTIGTSSVRRASQLSAVYPDMTILPVRGNIHSRLDKLDTGRFDAIILATAGLLRLGLESRITEHLTYPQFLPAPGQGAIAVETRVEDYATTKLISPLDDTDLRAATTAERHFLAAAGGGCNEPLGALATVRDGQLILEAGRYTSPPITQVFSGPANDPYILAQEAALTLLKNQHYE